LDAFARDTVDMYSGKALDALGIKVLASKLIMKDKSDQVSVENVFCDLLPTAGADSWNIENVRNIDLHLSSACAVLLMAIAKKREQLKWRGGEQKISF
jgi:hypothetical protein